MKHRKTLKQLYNEHKNRILIFFVRVSIAIALITASFFVSWNFMLKPMSDSQFEMCEQIARDVYEQKRDVIVEVPEDFSVKITTTTITVKSADLFVRGKVEASLCNGELVITRNLETVEAIIGSVLFGIMFSCLAVLILIVGVLIYEKAQKRKQRCS